MFEQICVMYIGRLWAASQPPVGGLHSRLWAAFITTALITAVLINTSLIIATLITAILINAILITTAL